MPSPSDNPPVVILDVMNLRDRRVSTRFRPVARDEPFRISSFDQFVTSLNRVVPGAVLAGIVDGSAASEDAKKTFATADDREELLRRTTLEPRHPQCLYLLPPKQKKQTWGWGRGGDLKYLSADPVCVHLLEKFPNAALISFDLLDKNSDIAYFPKDHLLRGSIFFPFWINSENSWVFLARQEVSQYSGWNAEFFRAVETGQILRIEDFLTESVTSASQREKTLERAYGFVRDCVNEHRAAGNRVIPIVLDWQKTRSPFDVLNPADFANLEEPVEVVDQEVFEVSAVPEPDILVRVATEQVDLIRSIDELNVYVGRQVRLHAMLRFVGDVPYLVWFGLATRVRVSLEGLPYPLTSGLVRVEGMLSESGGELKISVSSARDIRQQSIVDVISGRITRLVQGDLFASEGGDWGLPALPRRRASQVSPPPPPLPKPVSAGNSVGGNRGEVPSEPSVRIVRESSNDADTSDQVRVGHSTSGTQTITKTTSQAVELPKIPTIPRANRRSRKLLAVAVVATVAVAIAVTVALRNFVFAFELPEPAVCMDVEPAVCEEIVAEWRGDAIRVNLYGTRGPDGLVS